MKKLYAIFLKPVMLMICVYEIVRIFKSQPGEFLLRDNKEMAEQLAPQFEEKYDRHLIPMSILFWLFLITLLLIMFT